MTLDTVLSFAARISILMIGVLAVIITLHEGRFLLAPVLLAIIIGLMVSPLATILEKAGLPSAISATIVVASLIVLLITGGGLLVYPLSFWIERLPDMWTELQRHLIGWRSVFDLIGGLQSQLRDIVGTEASMTVEVEEESAVMELANIAPTAVAQLFIFLASLFFFVATRDQIRIGILSLCFGRRLRLRVAHAFKDAETFVSRYLLSITVINIVLGACVTVAMALLGLPSPLLWGLLAALLNYVMFIGPMVMTVILFSVGLVTFDTSLGALAPVLAYLALNLTESQFVTPHILGRMLTMNPFMVFLALAMWIWLWGPVGGFVAVPVLLVIRATLHRALPTEQITAPRPLVRGSA